MRKILTRYIALVLAVVVFIFLALQLKWLPTFSDIFSGKPVIIDNTPILIKEINELSQLTTVTAYDEVVADSFRVSSNNYLPRILPIPASLSIDRIVLVGKGRVTAGVDLRKIRESDIRLRKDSISLHLPKAEIFDAILNPSDFDTFTEEGEWTPEAVTLVKIKAREKMIRRVTEQGIISRADAKARQLMENFLSGIGFTKIHIE